MTYRSILVLLDQTAACEARTQFSIRLATSMGAHLTGWAPTGLDDPPALAVAVALGAHPPAMRPDVLRDNAERATRKFLQACEAAGLRTAEAFIEDGDREAGLAREAHCHDLVLVTQGDSSTASQTSLRLLVEQAILFCGRPVLVLPHTGGHVSTFTGSFDTAVVAWDDSRAAARAAADALPLLRRARRVQVLTFRDPSRHDKRGEDPGPARFSRWLERHGVRAEMHAAPLHGDVAASLRSHVAELRADLLVMGAYGHSRWKEHVLGGATQGLLASMTLPVLMSH
jgi:nucleotide-binding universal stress UspA family protein